MKTILYYSIIVVIFILPFLFMANTTVSIKPFKVTFERPCYSIGVFLIVVGIGLITHDSRKEGRNKVLKEQTEQKK